MKIARRRRPSSLTSQGRRVGAGVRFGYCGIRAFSIVQCSLPVTSSRDSGSSNQQHALSPSLFSVSVLTKISVEPGRSRVTIMAAKVFSSHYFLGDMRALQLAVRRPHLPAAVSIHKHQNPPCHFLRHSKRARDRYDPSLPSPTAGIPHRCRRRAYHIHGHKSSIPDSSSSPSLWLSKSCSKRPISDPFPWNQSCKYLASSGWRLLLLLLLSRAGVPSGFWVTAGGTMPIADRQPSMFLMVDCTGGPGCEVLTLTATAPPLVF